MVPGYVGQECGEDGGGDAHDGREPVRGADAPSRDDHSSYEWSDEQPDPKATAQGGESAGPERYRNGLGEVGVPGQTEHRMGQPGDRDGNGEQDQGFG